MESIVTPMNNSINNVGIVEKYNLNTREVAVYIPKFMPGIPEEKKETSAKTKYDGTIVSDISYASTIKTSAYIWAAAKDLSAKMPKVGSRVLLTYIDGNPDLLYWEAFNPNGDYTVVDDEKYDKVNSVTIGGRTVDLYEDDNLIINLPTEYRTTCIRQGKQILMNILSDSDNTETLNVLKNRVGEFSYYKTDKFGNSVKESGTGLSKDVETLERLVGGINSIRNFTELSNINAGDTLGDNVYKEDGNGSFTQVEAGSSAEVNTVYYSATLTKQSSGLTGAVVAINNKLASVIPPLPDNDGEYSLHCSISNGVPVYSWKKS